MTRKMLAWVVMLALCLSMGLVVRAEEDEVCGHEIYVSKTGGTLHLRAGQGSKTQSLGFVVQGDVVRLLEKGTNWSKIWVQRTNLTGYVNSKYIIARNTEGIAYETAIQAILSYHPGTAGASLKCVLAAVDILDALEALTIAQMENVSTRVNDMILALSEEERAQLIENFFSVDEMAQAILTKATGIQEQMETAGATPKFETYTTEKYARFADAVRVLCQFDRPTETTVTDYDYSMVEGGGDAFTGTPVDSLTTL